MTDSDWSDALPATSCTENPFHYDCIDELSKQFKVVTAFKEMVEQSRELGALEPRIVKMFTKFINDVKNRETADEDDEAADEDDEAADEDDEAADEDDETADEDDDTGDDAGKTADETADETRVRKALASIWAAARTADGSGFPEGTEEEKKTYASSTSQAKYLYNHAALKLKNIRGFNPLKSYYVDDNNAIIKAILALKKDPKMSIGEFRSLISKWDGTRQTISRIVGMLKSVAKALAFIGIAVGILYTFFPATAATAGSTLMNSFMGPILLSLGKWLGIVSVGLAGGGMWSDISKRAEEQWGKVTSAISSAWKTVKDKADAIYVRAAELGINAKAKLGEYTERAKELGEKALNFVTNPRESWAKLQETVEEEVKSLGTNLEATFSVPENKLKQAFNDLNKGLESIPEGDDEESAEELSEESAEDDDVPPGLEAGGVASALKYVLDGMSYHNDENVRMGAEIVKASIKAAEYVKDGKSPVDAFNAVF